MTNQREQRQAGIELRYDEPSTDVVQRMEVAFKDWAAEWDHALRDGGVGDVAELFGRLLNAFPNASKSSFENPSST